MQAMELAMTNFQKQLSQITISTPKAQVVLPKWQKNDRLEGVKGSGGASGLTMNQERGINAELMELWGLK